MNQTPSENKEFSIDVINWARKKLAQDEEYIQHSAKFGSPNVQGIARFILSIGQEVSL